MLLLDVVEKRGSPRLRAAVAAVEDGLREIGMLIERLEAAGLATVYMDLVDKVDVAIVTGKMEGRVEEARSVLRRRADNMVKVRVGRTIVEEVYYVSRGGVTAVLDLLPEDGKLYFRVIIPVYPFSE